MAHGIAGFVGLVCVAEYLAARRCKRSRVSLWVARGQERAPPGAAPDMDRLLSSLQGNWEDNVGRSIEVDDREARFNDGTGPWKIWRGRDKLLLRGAALVIEKAAQGCPAWRLPNGRELVWHRPEPVNPQDTEWATVFHQYKAGLVCLRQTLWAAIAAEDYEKANAVQAELAGSGAIPEFATVEQQLNLFAGRGLAPGVCFRDRATGGRGVIIACEPWRSAPLARRQLGGDEDMRFRRPFYHCLIDERDAPAGMPSFPVGDIQGPAAFMSEHDIEPAEDCFPVENTVASALLVRCDEIQGYLPAPILKVGLTNQRDGQPFAI